MKFMSRFFRSLAIIFLFVVVISLPISLFMRNASSLLFSPDLLLNFLDENIPDSEDLANIAEFMVENGGLQQSDQEIDPWKQLIIGALEEIPHDSWVELFDLIAPQEFVYTAVEQFLTGFYDWLNSTNTNEQPGFIVDLKPWKSNMITNVIPAMELVLNSLPQCSPDEVLELSLMVVLGDVSSMPQCRPPEPIYSAVLEIGASIVPSLVEELPDEMSIGLDLVIDVGGDLQNVKQMLTKMRLIMRAGWIAVLLLYAVAIPMGARNFGGIFRWAGWPMLLAGIHGLIIYGLTFFFNERIASSFSGYVLSGAPDVVVNLITAINAVLLFEIAKPLLNQAAIMLIVGAGFLVIAISFFNQNPDTTAR